LSNCCLVTVIAQSLVEGTVFLMAGPVSAGQRPRTLITGASGASSAGFSSRFNNDGGVACGVGLAVAAGEAGACIRGVLDVWATAVVAIRVQRISLGIIDWNPFVVSGKSGGNILA